MVSSIPASDRADLAPGAAPAVRPSRGRRTRQMALGGGVFVLLLVVTALAAPVIAPHDPVRQSLRARLAAPTLSAADGKAHVLGTDHLGRDVLSRMIHGARVSLLVGFAAVVVGGIVGATLGLLAGFRGGWTDTMIMTLADAQLAFPFILLAIVLEATLSFLGLGVQPPTPSWGGMVHEGREYLDSAWWISTAPGIVLMLTSIVVSRTGDWLRDLLDPTLRGE